MMWGPFPQNVPDYVRGSHPDDPKVAFLSEDLKRSMCHLLGLTFESSSKQPFNIVGEPLRKYEPWEKDEISGDGNCLFRCFSQILTGNQSSHLKIRSIISRFLASEGARQLQWYFKSMGTAPFEYMDEETPIYMEGTWGSDVEIMCASAILDADIYVANNDYVPQGSHVRQIRWSLLRATPNPTATIYIANYCNHYEPVSSMVNSFTPTFGICSNNTEYCQLVE